MRITMENAGYKNVRVIKPTGKSVCLRYQDMPDTAEMISAIQNATSEDEIFELAKKLVKTKEKKARVEANEHNIAVFTDYITNNAEQGDIINVVSICRIFNNHVALNGDGVVSWAAYYALRDLEKAGLLTRVKVKTKDNWSSHTYIAYVVK